MPDAFQSQADSRLTRFAGGFAFANLVGVVVLVIQNSSALVIAEGDAGGPDPIGTFAFCFTYELPLLLIFLAANLLWSLVLFLNRRNQNRYAVMAGALSGVIWLVTLICCRTAWATLFLFFLLIYEKTIGPLFSQ